MAEAKEPGSALQAPRRDAAKIAESFTNKALDEALGDKVSAELRKAVAKEIAPWAEKLVTLLDDAIRIPGTNIKIGLDPIIGLILPGVGDAITSTGSIALLLLALKERVPATGLLRMLLNVTVDTVVGAVPVLGDAFDAVYHSNRRNLDIIERYRRDPDAKASFADYAIVYGAIGIVVAGVFLPPVLLWLLITFFQG